MRSSPPPRTPTLRAARGRRLAAAALLLAAAGLWAVRDARAEARPAPGAAVDNVLLITVDTLRWDALGFAGNDAAETPILDRLAAGGRVYANAHAHNVETLPSHANILTGLLPYEHGIRTNSGFELTAEHPTAAALLSAAGFATGGFVGAFVLDSSFGIGRGFATYDDELPHGELPPHLAPAHRRGDEVVARALAWWRRHQDRRRFLWVHLYDPHTPYDPPEPFASRFADDAYLGEVAAVDAYLEPLLRPHLEGREPPTLIVFTSDHGEALGDHGEADHGVFAYEATLKVPLVLYGPGIEPGRTATPARHVDLLPTLLEAAGVEPPAGLPGRSLLRSGASESPPPTYFEALAASLQRGWAPLRGVIRDGFKLIVLPIPELYDLRSDPAEENNLVRQERRRAKELLDLLPEESVWPPEAGEVSEEQRAALESLGYLGGRAERKEVYTEADDPKTRIGELSGRTQQVMALYRQGSLEEALALAEEIRQASPELPEPYTYLTQILLRQGRLERAIEVMYDARARGVASRELLRQLGLTLAEAGRHREALAILPAAAETDDPEVLRVLGVVLSEAGRAGEARAALLRARELAPEHPQVHQNLALVALRAGDWEAARRAAERALELNDRLGLAWNYLGTALHSLGRGEEAVAAFQRSVELEPGNFDALFNLGVVAMEIRDAAVARRALERFVAEAPEELYAADIARARAWLARLPQG